MKTHWILGLALLAPPAATSAQSIQYEEFRLENGLRVVLSEDHSTPIVSVNLWYNVGSANERLTRTGFAHFFEHMMFQGSTNAGKGQHVQLIERAGGDNVNASTNADRTNYFQTVPSNRVNLALWLEADRMRSLAVTQDNLDNQRNAVQEEKRLRFDNQPYAASFLEGINALFDVRRCFGYAHSTIGSLEDLNAATVDDVHSFFRQYYAPNNATLTLVGDFDPDSVRNLVTTFFSDIPRAPEPPSVTCDWQVGTEERVIEKRDPLANLPAVVAAFPTPGINDPDAPAVALLAAILGLGESSRLNKALVRDEQLAIQAVSQVLPQRFASPFIVLAIANQGVGADLITRSVHAAIDSLVQHGVTEAELEKAKNNYRAADVLGRQTTMDVAERIQRFAHFYDTIDEMETDLDRYLRVSLDDIRRVARRYLMPTNRVTTVILPTTSPERPVQ